MRTLTDHRILHRHPKSWSSRRKSRQEKRKRRRLKRTKRSSRRKRRSPTKERPTRKRRRKRATRSATTGRRRRGIGTTRRSDGRRRVRGAGGCERSAAMTKRVGHPSSCGIRPGRYWQVAALTSTTCYRGNTRSVDAHVRTLSWHGFNTSSRLQTRRPHTRPGPGS